MPVSKKSTGGKRPVGRPKKSISPEKEVKKSKAKEPGPKEPEPKAASPPPAPVLYFTIKNCVLCEISLSAHKIPWNETLQKRFESFCTFLNLELDERHSWDYQQENFPFCPNCTSILDYLYILYNRLEKLHTNVALGVRKIRRIVQRTKAGEAEGKEKEAGKFQNALKSSKSLEYRVKFVRAQIMTAMNDTDSDNEEINLPSLEAEPAGKKSDLVQLQANEGEDVMETNDSGKSGRTPRFEVIRIKVDGEEGEAEGSASVAATISNSRVLDNSKSCQDAETQYEDGDVGTDGDGDSESKGEAEVEKLDEKDSEEFVSCDEADNEPIDEFQAFLEEQLEKRRKAAMRAEMLASRLVEEQQEEPIRDNLVADLETSVDQDFGDSEEVQLDHATMDFFEEKPDIIELDTEDDASHFPRRSVRPRKKVKYDKKEYVLASDEEEEDDDFDIRDQAMEEGSDSDFETRKTSEKRSNRQRKKSRVPKASQVPTSGAAASRNESVSERLPENVADDPHLRSCSETVDENSWLVPMKDVVNSIIVSEIPTPPEELFADQVRALQNVL